MVKNTKESELQAEWLSLKARLDTLLDRGETLSLFDPEANDLIFEVRLIRQQINFLAAIVDYAEEQHG